MLMTVEQFYFWQSTTIYKYKTQSLSKKKFEHVEETHAKTVNPLEAKFAFVLNF